MNTCPPELHSYICQLACTDDGQTARSLALVSKYLCEVARPYRYQSVAVTGADQIVELYAKLKAIPPHMRRIHHLFLSERSHRTIEDPHYKRAPHHMCETETTSIIQLLTLAAQTLETLTFAVPYATTSCTLIATLFSIVFPRLLELTVIGYYPFPHVPASLPRLERLHLRGNRNPHGLLQMGTLNAVCPRLTHLRVSDLSMAVSFVDELEEALNGDHANTGSICNHLSHEAADACPCTCSFHPPSQFRAKIPPEVKCLVIQPGPELNSEFARQYRMCTLKDRAMMEQLMKLREVDENMKGVQYVLLQRGVPGEDLSEVARREWAERLDGQDSCWRVDQQDAGSAS